MNELSWSMARLLRGVWVLTWSIAATLFLVEHTFSAEPPVSAGYHRPAAVPDQSRSVVLATGGIVATSQPLAAQAGLEVLRQGGTAADAAIAANAVLGVVEPMSCGIGGDLFAIYWDAKTQRLYGLNASGRSPFALTRDVFRKEGLKDIPTEGPLAWSVPGCVAGWDDLHRRFGSLSLGADLAPAIHYAEDGFPVSEIIAGYWKGAESALRRWPDSTATFLIDDRAPHTAEIFRNPNLARTLREIAEKGRDAFYFGRNAETMVAFSKANSGFFSLRDLAEHKNEWVEPVSTNYRGYDVWELPPNGQGIAALQMLNLLEPYNLKAIGPGSAEYWHLFVEAKKLAFADRAKYYADPAGQDLPVAELISKEYAQRRGRLIDSNRASISCPLRPARLSVATAARGPCDSTAVFKSTGTALASPNSANTWMAGVRRLAFDPVAISSTAGKADLSPRAPNT